ncbi:hypothetical protein JCM8547_007005 [Rhodosporidiobolus lusitaniae]
MASLVKKLKSRFGRSTPSSPSSSSPSYCSPPEPTHTQANPPFNTASFGNLPSELILHIFSLVEISTGDAIHPATVGKQLSLMSRATRAAGQSLVFRDLSPVEDCVVPLRRHLDSYPHLGRHVRTLVLPMYELSWPVSESTVASLLFSLPNLKSLTLDGYNGLDTDDIEWFEALLPDLPCSGSLKTLRFVSNRTLEQEELDRLEEVLKGYRSKVEVVQDGGT